jgi:hypothetical protein
VLSAIIGRGDCGRDIGNGNGDGDGDGDGTGDGEAVNAREDEGDMGADLMAISDDVRERDTGADMGIMKGMEAAARAGAVAGGAVGEGEEVKGIIGLEFSDEECWPSSNLSALRNASFSRCTSLSSSSVSARLIRSVATILFA